jgi:hypothetical protein
MLFRDTIKLPHMALRLVPKVLDAVDVIMPVSKKLRVIDPEVLEVRNI